MGTEYDGMPVGRKGTAISPFTPIKNITTGEGGMVCTDDPEFETRIRRLKFHGLGVDAFDRQTQGRAPQAEVIEPGYKYNLPDILGGAGIGQLARLSEMNSGGRMLAEYYLERLRDILRSGPWHFPTIP